MSDYLKRTGEVGLDVSSLLNLRLQEIKIVDSLRLKKPEEIPAFLFYDIYALQHT